MYFCRKNFCKYKDQGTKKCRSRHPESCEYAFERNNKAYRHNSQICTWQEFCKHRDYQTNECMATWHYCEHRQYMNSETLNKGAIDVAASVHDYEIPYGIKTYMCSSLLDCRHRNYMTGECMATSHHCEYRIMMDYRNKTR